jgi:hypothetical protein
MEGKSEWRTGDKVFLLALGVESSWVHSARGPLIGQLYLPRVIMMMENLVNEDWLGKPKYSEKTCPSATLSTTNLT